MGSPLTPAVDFSAICTNEKAAFQTERVNQFTNGYLSLIIYGATPFFVHKLQYHKDIKYC